MARELPRPLRGRSDKVVKKPNITAKLPSDVKKEINVIWRTSHRRCVMKCFAASLFLLFAFSALAGDGHVRRVGKPVPGQYIAVFDESAVGPAHRQQAALAVLQQTGARRRIIFAGFPGFSFEANEAVAAAIARRPDIAWVEENAEGESAQQRPFPPGLAFDRSNQHFPPLDDLGGRGCSNFGDKIRIYIMDTGISDPGSVEFGARLRHLYKTGVTWVFGDVSSGSHGTAVASLAAGMRHGLAPEADVVNVKISENNKTYTDHLIDGISWIDVDHYTSNLNSLTPYGSVVNISWYLASGEQESKYTALDVAVQNSLKGCQATEWTTQYRYDGVSVYREMCTSYKAAPAARGITYVVGAGNSNHSVVGSPARLGDDALGTITVGATMMINGWTSGWRGQGAGLGWNGLGSNYGPPVDIWAPGTEIDAYHSNGQTDKFTGTSGSSPLVAGHVARLLKSYPSFTSSQIETQLKSMAVSTYPDGSPVIKDVPGGLLFQYDMGRCRAVRSLYQSGQPYQLESVLPYRPLTGSTSDTNRYAEPAGRRRSPAHHQLDLKYTQNLVAFRGATVQLIADVFNVYDKQTGYNYETRISTLGFTTRTDIPTVEIPETIPQSVLTSLNLAPGARVNAPVPELVLRAAPLQVMARVQF